MSDEQHDEALLTDKHAERLHDLAVRMARLIPEHNRESSPQVSAISINFVLPGFGDLVMTVDVLVDEIDADSPGGKR